MSLPIRPLDRLRRTLGLPAADGGVLQESLRGDYRPLYGAMSSPNSALGQILANYVAVNFIGGAHTSDFVELAALGPASEAIDGFVLNTDLFDLMVTAGGVLEWAGG
jgi:alkaline phosphatase